MFLTTISVIYSLLTALIFGTFFLCSHAGLEFSVLAQRVLAEVPDQVLNYMELHHIKPNKIEA